MPAWGSVRQTASGTADAAAEVFPYLRTCQYRREMVEYKITGKNLPKGG